MRLLVARNGRKFGLGNRLRLSLAARSLADATDRDLRIVWPRGTHFGPRFADLWVDPIAQEMSYFTSRALSLRYPYLDSDLFGLEERADDAVVQVYTGRVLELPDRAEPWDEGLRRLTPTEHIAERVTSLVQRFNGDPFVGVQMRVHGVSHAKTKLTSPVEWFVERLDAIYRERPGVRFFISCDDPKTQERMVARYRGAVGQLKAGGYNTTDGVREAVVDLYCLASAGYLLGPAHSSFVGIAVHLAARGIPFETPVKDPHLIGGTLDEMTVAINPLRPAERRLP